MIARRRAGAQSDTDVLSHLFVPEEPVSASPDSDLNRKEHLLHLFAKTCGEMTRMMEDFYFRGLCPATRKPCEECSDCESFVDPKRGSKELAELVESWDVHRKPHRNEVFVAMLAALRQGSQILQLR